MTHETDAVIVGAGPAGCAAAIGLARAGLDVRILEASALPRHRPGESLHPGVEPIFEKLGVVDAVNRAGFLRHSGHHVRWEEGEPERFDAFGSDERGEWRGYQAWRPELDAILLAEARNLGAVLENPGRAVSPIVESERVIGVETDRGLVKGRFLLDASGRSHWLARKLQIGWDVRSPPLTARYGYAEMPSDEQNPRMMRDPEGWTWLAPVGNDRWAWVRMRFDGIDPGQEWLPLELEQATSRSPSKGADVTWRMAKQVAGAGWFLLGDAAAVLDPAASHGVLRALMTGMQAASLGVNAIRERVSEQDAASHYTTWLRTWFETDTDRLRELYGTNAFAKTQEQRERTMNQKGPRS